MAPRSMKTGARKAAAARAAGFRGSRAGLPRDAAPRRLALFATLSSARSTFHRRVCRPLSTPHPCKPKKTARRRLPPRRRRRRSPLAPIRLNRCRCAVIETKERRTLVCDARGVQAADAVGAARGRSERWGGRSGRGARYDGAGQRARHSGLNCARRVDGQGPGISPQIAVESRLSAEAAGNKRAVFFRAPLTAGRLPADRSPLPLTLPRLRPFCLPGCRRGGG